MGGRGVILTYDGYRYERNKITGECIYWRCVRAECRSSLKSARCELQPGENPEVLQSRGHDHARDEELTTHSEFMESLKTRIRRDPSQSARRTFDAHVAERHRNGLQGGGDRAPIPAFSSARSSIKRTRQESVPRIPQTIEDVNIFGVWQETWNGRQFLQHHSPDWGMTMFLTRKNLKILRRCPTVYMYIYVYNFQKCSATL